MCFLGLKNNEKDEMFWAGEHPYYIERCQKRVFPTHKKWLKIRYPNIRPDLKICWFAGQNFF